MEEIIKQDKSKSHSEFENLLTKDLGNRKFKEGEVTAGTISQIGKKFIFIDLGLKSEGTIPIEEFKLTKELDKIKVGSKIEVLLEKIENKNGDMVISREKARKAQSWKKMENAFENKEEVEGVIVSRCKGGFIVEVESCLCFLPGSQVDLKPLKNYDHLIKTQQTFECIKLDKRRGNIVLSRRTIMERIRNKDRDKVISKMKEGDIVSGIVKNLTEWGAFIDLQGVDALLHITDISWDRISRPSELLSIGQTIKAKIIKIEEGTKKISLGVKQLNEDPYLKSIHNYEIGKNYPATITKVQDYGCFAKLEEGLEGLIHQSELSWTKKNINPGKILSTSQKIEVQILEKNIEKRRISLSYKNTLVNPWVKFTNDHKVGDETEGIIKNITDYGLFASIKDSELSGMIHYKDLSWSEKESELENYKKNQLIKFKIVEINQEKERVRLGIKQLAKDPFEFFMNKNLSDVVTVIVESSSKEGIFVHSGNKNLLLLIKKNQLAKEVENQRSSRFAKGNKVDAMIVGINKDKKKVTLSIKSLEEKLMKEQVEKYGSTDSGGILGDIFNLKPLLNKKIKK
ncbi:MAG: 30S ribosomal protein S1 [Pelagibacteraceae bacterium]|jgi:small subunit ribosomal protein S1|nr:30S ribosomal protein S1 [Pelagibacteraceae bacterium]MDP6710137.1 30S ribosomal protein S1 [Pelagibacteraceae bacterium]|tara:strand:+ start:770 stop:2482 length:1713 start_codon:yes stop_codon:yes gene_type:complete